MKRKALFLLTLLALLSVRGQPPQYHVIDLGTLGGTNSVAEGISPSGLVTGQSLGADGVWHLFLYDGTMHDLGAYNGNDTYGNAINDNRQIAGYYRVPGLTGNYPYHGFLYDGTNINDLGTMGGTGSSGNGINSAGVVVGWSYLTNGSTRTDGYLYFSNSMHALGGYYCNAVSIDDSNRIVGYNYIFTNSAWLAIAFIHDGTFHYLGTLGGKSSMAVCSNPAGQVVGESATTNNETHGFLYDGTMRDLGTFGGDYSYACWINSHGDICGVATLTNDAEHGFIYTGGVMYDLNTLLDASSANWIIEGGWSMNDAGVIVGSGIDPVSGETHAVLLSPLAQLRISGFEVTATNTLAIAWAAVAGLQYQVQALDPLGSTEWRDIGPLVTAQSTTGSVVLPFAITNKAGLYRIRQPVSQ